MPAPFFHFTRKHSAYSSQSVTAPHLALRVLLSSGERIEVRASRADHAFGGSWKTASNIRPRPLSILCAVAMLCVSGCAQIATVKHHDVTYAATGQPEL